MSRRARGEGTVLRDGSGWIARIDLPPGPDGRRRRQKRRAPTKTAAIAALKVMQAELDLAVDAAAAGRTVAAAVESYVSSRPRSTRSTKTVEMEAWRASLIVAGLGRRRLGKLTVVDCDDFLKRAAAGEYGSRPIGREALGRIRSLLVQVLRNEMRTGALGRNVAELSALPADDSPYDLVGDDDDGDSSSSLRRTLDYEEFRRLWRSARLPLLVVVELCGRNGLRPSEARGLRWECVDVEAKTVTVNRQLSSGDRLTKPKTRRSLRTIPVDDLTLECLTTWRARQARHRQRAGDLWTTEPDLVISTRFGTAINRNNLTRMLSAACEDAGVQRIVPYELRHTAITLQLDAGSAAWRVADWAGTSERMIEQIYRHRLTRVSELGSVQLSGLNDRPLGPTLGPGDRLAPYP